MLSLLQVVVATMLSQGVWFGVLLVAYMLVGFWAMTLLCLYRQNARPAEEQAADERSAPQGRSAGRRWPWIAQTPEFTSSLGGSSSAGVGRELFGRLTVMGLGTLALTLLLFFSLPRLGRVGMAGRRRGHPARRRLLRSGHAGRIGRDHREPRRSDARRVDRRRDRRPLYRSRRALPARVDSHALPGRTMAARGRRIVRAWRPAAGCCRPRPGRRCCSRSWSNPWIATSCSASGRLSASSPTPACGWSATGCCGPRRCARSGSPSRWERRPFPTGSNRRWRRATIGSTRSRCCKCPRCPSCPASPGFGSHRRRPPPTVAARPRHWSAYFQDPARFQYSLQGQVRELDLDPIEDFLTKNPRGHCEYFATALTLMLRSRGIPARVVVGYRCDEYNDLGKFYQVRQWHAHSWVEAYLGPQDLPAELRRGDQAGRWARGGWLRLEPTPGFGADQPASTPKLGAVRRSLLWLQSVWGNYVLEMDRDRQREAIYGPAVRAVREAIGRSARPGLVARACWPGFATRWISPPGPPGNGSWAFCR